MCVPLVSTHLGPIALLVSILLSACSPSAKAPDMTRAVRDSLNGAGLTDVSVSQDRDRAVVTLKGSVATESDKVRAESIAKAVAEDQVIANEIAVLPPGAERVAKSVNAAQDYEIKKNLDAELLLHALHDEIKYDVKNGVVTLRGAVSSEKHVPLLSNLPRGSRTLRRSSMSST